jgi:hypothetical protein
VGLNLAEMETYIHLPPAPPNNVRCYIAVGQIDSQFTSPMYVMENLIEFSIILAAGVRRGVCVKVRG